MNAAADMFALPGTVALRDYQVLAVEKFEAARRAGKRAPLLVAPTGSGKTVIAAELVRREVAAGGRALFLAPRRELVAQASRKLREFGVGHGVLLAGADHLRDDRAPVQVASVDTLLARILRRGLLSDLPSFSLVVVDEAHLAITARRLDLLAGWPGAKICGLTATPIRRDGVALGLLFDDLIEVATVPGLVASGALVSARYFSLTKPDLEKVRITAGDYNGRDLNAAVNRPHLVGDVVATWLARAADRRTVVFCAGVPHSIAVAEAFQRAGVVAEHVDADTPNAEREEVFRRFTRGESQVLTNCFLASYGFDLPALNCVVLARPTRSTMLYLQMVGRGLRPADGKHDCLVLDHAGCVHVHGFADTERTWSLEGHCGIAPGSSARVPSNGEANVIECPECRAVYSKTRTCPECGHRLTPPPRDVETLAGNLVELGAITEDGIDRKAFYCELRAIGIERRYNPKWAAAQFHDRFGEWPPWAWNNVAAIEPTEKTRRWVRSRMIAYAKARERGAA